MAKFRDEGATSVASLQQQVASQDATIAYLRTRIDTELPRLAEQARLQEERADKMEERANKTAEQIRVLTGLLAGAKHTQ